jgi:hypothetical protein
MFELAHFGHWYVQLVFAGPMLLLVLIGLADNRREKRRKRNGRPPQDHNHD